MIALYVHGSLPAFAESGAKTRNRNSNRISEELCSTF